MQSGHFSSKVTVLLKVDSLIIVSQTEETVAYDNVEQVLVLLAEVDDDRTFMH